MQIVTRRNFLNVVERGYRPDAASWLHVNRVAMACRFEVTVPLQDEAGVVVATDALDQIDQLEDQLSVFRPNSEVSRINEDAATAPLRVTESLFNLLTLCKRLHCETEGAFDITSGPLTRCWGFLKREGRMPSEGEIEIARRLADCSLMVLDEESRTVSFSKRAMEINLGSVGKGYALERVAARLRPRGRPALLNAGASSIVAVGEGDQNEGWSVGLRHPRNKGKRLASLRLKDCALSTSGNEEQFFEVAGQRYGHIIDPRSGWPAREVTSVSVITRSGAISDALATAFYVGGRKLAERFCSAHPDVMAIMLESESEIPVVIGNYPGCRIESVA